MVEKRLTEYARDMRRGPTGPEAALWRRLRRRQMLGLRFRRQQPVGPYIVDFYCAEIKMVIELDGCQVLRIGSEILFEDAGEVIFFSKPPAQPA